LTTRIGTFSLFWMPYHMVPGAIAIRAGGRVQLLDNLWVVVGLSVLLQYWTDASALARRRRLALSIAILMFCLIEQINLLPAGLSRTYEYAWLSTITEPPLECRAFVVDIPTPPASFLDDDDAIWISVRTGVPTLNGSSGWFPPHWHLHDAGIDYFDATRQWITQTRLNQQVCIYDRAARQWSRFHWPTEIQSPIPAR
jgi:hypothetical protein